MVVQSKRQRYDNTTPITGDETLTARWTPQNTGGGGSGGSSGGGGSTPTTPTVQSRQHQLHQVIHQEPGTKVSILS